MKRLHLVNGIFNIYRHLVPNLLRAKKRKRIRIPNVNSSLRTAQMFATVDNKITHQKRDTQVDRRKNSTYTVQHVHW